MAEETEGTRLLRGDQRKGIIAMAIPIGVALLFQQLNNIIDSLWMPTSEGMPSRPSVSSIRSSKRSPE